MIDWKKKSAMAILAGGLFGGSEAQAQPINTNLVANPSFELPGSGNVATWTGTGLGTYQYSQGYTSVNVPPSAGLLYLHGPAAASGNTTQTIDLVAAGFSPAFIDAGVNYSLSGYFSTYFSTGDYATITAQFLDAASASIGTSNAIGGQAFVAALPTANNVNGVPGYNDWGQSSTGGTIPVGSRFVAINILHTRLGGTACDSYTDLVDFQVTAIPEPGTLLLTSASAGVTLVLRLRRRKDAPKS